MPNATLYPMPEIIKGDSLKIPGAQERSILTTIPPHPTYGRAIRTMDSEAEAMRRDAETHSTRGRDGE